MLLLQQLTSLCGVVPLQQWLLRFKGKNNDTGTSLFPSVRGSERDAQALSVSFQLPSAYKG